MKTSPFSKDDFSHLSTYLLAGEAQKMGLPVRKIFPESRKSILSITLNARDYTFVGQRSPFLSFSAYKTCKNKGLTKAQLQQAGIRTPEGAIFEKQAMKAAVRYAEALAKPIVIKPFDGLHGKDVFVGIASAKEAQDALEALFKDDQVVLIERQVPGTEYRVLATRKALLSVIQRVPANVTGDGIHTIGQLIDAKNEDPRRGDYTCPLITIKKDADLKAYIRNKGYTPDSVPRKGETVFLRATSNLSTGGDSIDVTNQAHENLKQLAPAIIRAVPGLPFGGIDLIIEDIALDPYSSSYAVIELNSSPMLSMHHQPYQGEGRNVSRVIIEEMMATASNCAGL